MQNLSTKLFAGCHINSELRMYLNKSIQWKHATILTPTSERKLQEVHFRGKDYFGLYTDSTKISVLALTKIQQSIRESLKNYCPDLETEKIKVCIFPQVFIS